MRERHGAGEGIRTLDINLGKVALYQLSYTRTCEVQILSGYSSSVNKQKLTFLLFLLFPVSLLQYFGFMSQFITFLPFIILFIFFLPQAKAQEKSTVADVPTSFSIDFVTIRDPNNPPDPFTHHGSVALPFQLQKNNVTVRQYCFFLTAVATSNDPYHLYDERMFSDALVHSIQREGPPDGPYQYSIVPGQEESSVVYVSYLSAIRFCNWLHNEKKGPGTTETGAYTLSTSDPLKFPTANIGALFSLSTPDQWCKGAYYCGALSSTGYSYPDITSQSTWSGIYGLEGLFSTIQWLDSGHSGYGPFSDYGALYWGQNSGFSANNLGFRVATPANF